MQQLARTIVNPSAGYRVTFLQTSAETNGQHTYVEVTLPPGAGTPMHYHLKFTETFEALEGALGLQLGKQIIQLRPGEKTAFVPSHIAHRFFNPGKSPIVFRAVIRPASTFEQSLRITYGLGNDGLANKKGLPKNIWHLALVFQIGESYLPGIPLFIQRGIFGTLAAIARSLGRHKDLEKYYIGEVEKPVAYAV